MKIRTILFAALLLPSIGCFATEYVKETKLISFGAQATRPVQPSTQNLEFLNFATVPGSPLWAPNGGSGGATCAESAAVLPVNNAILRSIALAAVTSGATVQVTVDNTLTMVGSYCQVTTLAIKAN